MKFNNKYFFTAFLLASVSCSLADDIIIKEDAKYLYASIDKETSKVALTDEVFGDLAWIPGDKISLFSNDRTSNGGFLASTDNDGTNAAFNVTGFEYQGTLYGLYPYSEDATIDYNSGVISSDLSGEQKAFNISEGKKNLPSLILIGSAESDANKISFYNAACGIRFSVNRDDIKKVVFKGNNNEVLAGNYRLSVNKPYTITPQDAVRQITLTSEEGFIKGQLYYLTFFPTEFSNGFTFEFYDSSDHKIKTTSTYTERKLIRGVFGTIKDANDDDSMNKVNQSKDLSIDGPANCYVVSSYGRYKLPLVRGNNPYDKIDDANSAEIVWETFNTTQNIASGSLLNTESISINGGYLMFEPVKDFKQGNALLAVKDVAGKILWSWHIWFVSEEPKGISANGKTFMDRNLGALTSTANNPLSMGLLYQYGRKDPFMGGTSFSNNDRMTSTKPSDCVAVSQQVCTVEYTILHPDTYIINPANENEWIVGSAWKDNKTSHDPCPPGWVVAGNRLLNLDNFNYNRQFGMFNYSVVNDFNFPASGFIDPTTGNFYQAGYFGCFWTSYRASEDSNPFALQLYINKSYNFTSEYTNQKSCFNGFSVRCVKE